ncbi:MAG: decaprenyl-phosphate phosphoribosyltransferase [Actinobacteria bacterium]|nr:decaprenyl-phosphate phosphoribosyltransferase [Actinomycetota bacterium]
MLRDYIRLLRPKHWIKNIFVLAGIVFGKQLLVGESVLLALQGFVCFCGLSSAAYILNDLRDRKADRQHPTRKKRPLADGSVSAGPAAGLAIILAGGCLAWAAWLDGKFAAIGLAYLVLNIAYTVWLKNQPIVDVIAISIGFVLRAVAGVVLLDVELSPWLIVCTFCLCLFLGFGKRRGELNELGEQASAFRKVHELYTPAMLDHMLSVTSGITVVAFLMYTLHPHTQEWIGNNYLLYTMPLVLYGIFRFSLLIQSGRAAGPVEVILRDRPFQATLLGWGLICLGIIYGSRLSEIVAGGS